MPRITAFRIVLAVVFVMAVGLGAAFDARGEITWPTVELLAPAAGANVVVSADQNKWPTYKARVTYPPGYTGPPSVTFLIALDAGFTRNRSGNGASCAAGVIVCEVSVTTRTN